MRTDRALRELLRTARGASRLSQSAAAEHAGVSRSWWRKVENATELGVDDGTMLDMLQAVGVQAKHLRRVGHKELADKLIQREIFRSDGATSENLQEYLSHAPADDETKRALMITARTLEEIREGHHSDPFADQFPPREK